LVEQLGGKSTPAFGFALGIERLVLMLTEMNKVNTIRPQVDAYLVVLGDDAQIQASKLAEEWRDHLPDIRLQCHCGGGNMKKQLKRADKSGASVALILGDDEINQEKVMVKYLRGQKEQESVEFSQISSLLRELI
jgi:histidyl-tRNA synthetase